MLLRRRAELVCQQAVELVTDYLEGALSRRDRIRFERHVVACPHCKEYFRQIQLTIETSGRVDPETLPEPMREELVALYRQWRSS